MAHLGTPSAVVEDVGVLPEMQGNGIGKAMMEFGVASMPHELRAGIRYVLW